MKLLLKLHPRISSTYQFNWWWIVNLWENRLEKEDSSDYDWLIKISYAGHKCRLSWLSGTQDHHRYGPFSWRKRLYLAGQAQERIAFLLQLSPRHICSATKSQIQDHDSRAQICRVGLKGLKNPATFIQGYLCFPFLTKMPRSVSLLILNALEEIVRPIAFTPVFTRMLKEGLNDLSQSSGSPQENHPLLISLKSVPGSALHILSARNPISVLARLTLPP